MGYFTSIYAEDLPHRAISVYMYLKDRAGKKDNCYPAIGTIAKDLGLSRSTVKRAIKDLERVGYIIEKQERWRENGSRSSNDFIIKK